MSGVEYFHFWQMEIKYVFYFYFLNLHDWNCAHTRTRSQCSVYAQNKKVNVHTHRNTCTSLCNMVIKTVPPTQKLMWLDNFSPNSQIEYFIKILTAVFELLYGCDQAHGLTY